MWKAKAHDALPKVMESYPGARWLFLTLTVKNVPLEDLRQTVTLMNKGFARLSQLKAFPAKGWIKSLEVTRSRTGMAHPHFHVLLMVNASYFKTGYVSQVKWREMWQKSMRLDYDPVVDIRPIKEGQDVATIIPEILKYQTKESDLVAEQSWLVELTTQMSHVRAVAIGGVLRPFMKELEEEPQDLIGTEGEEEVVPDLLLGFRWRSRIKKYTAE